jgi:hypothetical protein
VDDDANWVYVQVGGESVYGKRVCLCVEFEGSINTCIVVSRARHVETRPAKVLADIGCFLSMQNDTLSAYLSRYNTARITQVISSLDLSLAV